MRIRGIIWLALLAFVLPLVPAGAAQWQSLAELVKQQPKPTRKAARVITNDDLPERPPESKQSPNAADSFVG